MYKFRLKVRVETIYNFKIIKIIKSILTLNLIFIKIKRFNYIF